MNAASIISPSSSINNSRAEPSHGTGRTMQRSKPLNTAVIFTRHHCPVSHQSSTAGNAAAASFDRTTAHPAQSGPARERHGSSGLRSVHLDSVRMAELVGREAPTDTRLKRDLVQLQPGGAGRPTTRVRAWVRRSRRTTGRPAASRARTATLQVPTTPTRPSRPGGGDRSCHA
jgi:hypothetical protein